MKAKGKFMDNDWAALYLGIFGILIQAISFAVIYLLSNYIGPGSAESTTTTLIYVWYLFPVLALLPLTLAILQIRQHKTEGSALNKPLAGLLVNIAWILGVVVFATV